MKIFAGGLQVFAFALTLPFVKQASCELHEKVFPRPFGNKQVQQLSEIDALALLRGNKNINVEKPKGHWDSVDFPVSTSRASNTARSPLNVIMWHPSVVNNPSQASTDEDQSPTNKRHHNIPDFGLRRKRFLRQSKSAGSRNTKDDSRYPFFENKDRKRHEYRPNVEDAYNYYQPDNINDINRNDEVIIRRLPKPWWFETAYNNLGNYLTFNEMIGQNKPKKERLVTDTSKIMKLNFRHVMRGA